jgi:hypothetical protein
VTLEKAPAAGGGAPISVTVRVGGLVAGKTDARYAARSGLGFAVSVPQYGVDRALSARLEDLVKK